jgi:CDP-glycerol glycerophosphotransferase (TagB/SpsB family)
LPRHEAFASLDLAPSRPVITLATAGALDKGFHGRDETHLVEDILRMMGESEVLKGAQLVIRLHPTSRLEFFWRYWNHPSIKFSFASYMPGLMWCPSWEDLVQQTTLLRHSDVIVTPASSWVLEAAIFDTPTVVPVYSDLQPDHAAALFNSWTLARHYKPLVENKWVPITRSYDETRSAIEEAFMKPSKYTGGRQAIVDNYVYYRDSDSCQRVATWIANIANTTRPGHPRGF